MDVVLLSLILGGILVYYLYLIRNYGYWRKQGVPCARGLLPGVGHMWPVMSLRSSLADLSLRMYESHPDCSMVGFFDKTTPGLVIREPKLVKTVMLTGFTNFSENMLKVDPQLDPLFAVNPFFSMGKTWYISRKRLTRAFTGNKLKIMYSCIEDICKELDVYVGRKLRDNEDALEIELRDLFSRYTGNVVASVACGVNGLCFEGESHPSSFATMGKLTFNPTLRNKIGQTLNFFLPELNKILRMPFVPRQVDDFFRTVVKESLRIRLQEPRRRNDFLQLMLDHDSGSGQLDEAMLTAHAFSFFADGYDTSSITLSFIGYYLARNPDVQRRLRDEVETVLASHDDQLTYESLNEMVYLQQVISESQRLYSASGVNVKICTKECELTGSDGLRCRVQPGMKIFIPVFGLQRDPKYWPDPNTFDPDRFAEGRKSEIEKFTFLPFGEGPRTCVGKRIALLQVKAAAATLVRKYSLEISPRTREPLKLSPGSFLTAPDGGLWVYIRRL